jgi:hypothetical protein
VEKEVPVSRFCVVSLAVGLLSVGGPATAAEVTRTVRAELSPPAAGGLAVENLAGSMNVVRGDGATVVAIATIHAESQALADAVSLEEVRGEKGRPTLRVRYPLDQEDLLRYPDAGGGNSSVKYDGHRVKVSDSRGVLLYADVEVRLPAAAVTAVLVNHVGSLRGQGVEGDLTFDTGSGNVTLEKVKGTLVADTGSGDVDIRDAQGSLRCDTGSGNCQVRQFQGDKLVCDTGSGEVEIHEAQADRLEADTGSGDVQLEGIDAERIKVDTGSGNVEVEAPSARLTRIEADTGSGNVHLRLGPSASFEARADTGSGDVRSRYADAEPILDDHEVVGYRRGDARIRIDVDTGSGNLVLEP